MEPEVQLVQVARQRSFSAALDCCWPSTLLLVYPESDPV